MASHHDPASAAASAWNPPSSRPPRSGALGTEALVHLGSATIRGRAAALRALADALVEAAELAEAYDADPDAFNERERAEPDLDA